MHTFVRLCAATVVLMAGVVAQRPLDSSAQDQQPPEPAQFSSLPPEIQKQYKAARQKAAVITVQPLQTEFKRDPALVLQQKSNSISNEPDHATSTPASAPATPGGGSITPFGSIQGTVTASDTGLPVNNVAVVAFDKDNQAVFGGTTDRSGQYSFTVYASGNRTYWLRVNPSGVYPYYFRPEWYDNQPSFATATPLTVTVGITLSNIDFVLDKGAQISGVVTASDTGLPLKDVAVSVIDADDMNVDMVRTDAMGRYLTGGLQPGVYRLWFNPSTNAESNPFGSYVAEYFENRASLADATPITVTGAAVVPNVDVALERGGTITGVVTAADTGAPLTSTVVILLDPTTGSYLQMTSPDATGAYRFDGLSAGGYKLLFRPPWQDEMQYAAEYYNNKDSFEQADILSITGGLVLSNTNAQLDVNGVLQGVVTDASTGMPLQNASVALAAEGDSIYPLQSPAYTDAQGAFAIHAPNGRYRVYVGAPYSSGLCSSYHDNAVDAQSATYVTISRTQINAVNVALLLPSEIRGTVIAADTGRPMADVQVMAAKVSEPGGAYANTDAQGHYTLTGLCNGRYAVNFSPSLADADQYVQEYYDNRQDRLSLQPVSVRGNQTVDGINAALDRGGRIRLSVMAEDTGQPLPNVWVSFNAGSSVTNENGQLLTSALVPGAYRLRFFTGYPLGPSGDYAAEYYDHKLSSDEADAVVVNANQTVSITAKLRRYAHIYGRVILPPAFSDVAVNVTLLSSHGETISWDEWPNAGTIDLPVAAGEYKLHIHANDSALASGYYDQKASLASGDVISVAANSAVTVTIAIPTGGAISGTVIDAVTSLPVPYPQVVVYGDDDREQTFYRVDSDLNGKFRVLGVPSGKYKLSISQYSYATRFSGGKTSLTDAELISVSPLSTTVVNMSLVPTAALPVQRYLPVAPTVPNW